MPLPCRPSKAGTLRHLGVAAPAQPTCVARKDGLQPAARLPTPQVADSLLGGSSELAQAVGLGAGSKQQ